MGNVQPASLHLFRGLNQLAFHFAPIQLIEQTPSELYLAVFCVTRTTPVGKAQFLEGLLLVKAQVTVPLTSCPQLAAEFCKFYFPNSLFLLFPSTLSLCLFLTGLLSRSLICYHFLRLILRLPIKGWAYASRCSINAY